MHHRFSFAALASVAALVAACGNPLYSPCAGQADCTEGLRCVDLGGEQRICTRPCTTTKARAGWPEGFANEELFVDGSGVVGGEADPQCADDAVKVLAEDNPDEGAQNILVASDGIVGVCRVTPLLLADPKISNESELVGICAPL